MSSPIMMGWVCVLIAALHAGNDVQAATGCYTKWFDRDNPSGNGDYETLRDLRRENPGQICQKPFGIEAQTTSGMSVASTGDVIAVSNTIAGFICKNADQKKGYCSDYRVRFECPRDFCSPPGCYTKWFDRDDPSGTGDYETLRDLQRENPGQICPKPFGIEVQTTSGMSVASTGDVIAVSNSYSGFICKNSDQKYGMCSDYRVRFECPIKFCFPIVF
ncbi:cartilage intermediate layer protein 2-like [Dunckerocampus dactyliophorus]|uniref:cartilage intermediate layer protein 2-like n=1 Tax=Dunckerocampus dactyliophorus TaxID=161453 RepID=UPI0024072AC1|nr:cartilage intermediate layer protein 2-like [Dunckerocampus dactyliophorus]